MRIFIWQNRTLPTGDQQWISVTEHGEVLATHCSSNRTWGQIDVGPTGFYADRYPEGEHEIVVLPRGEVPPPEVLKAAEERYGVVKSSEAVDG